MNLPNRILFGVLFGGLVAGTALAQVGARVDNWAVPAYRGQAASGGLSLMTDISPGTTFVAMTPCRVFDTRAAVGPYGGPRLIANTTRNFDIDSGPCGPIPAGVEAYSMNFGAIQADGDGFITIWPAGSAQPTVSAINTLAGEVIANSAIVPAGAGGSISVFPNTGVHLYGDINGYFTDIYNAGNQLVQSGNVSGTAVGLFINSANTSNSAGVTGVVGPSFADAVCCGPVGVIGRGAFNGVAGVAQDRATVGVLVTGAGAHMAEGMLGKSGALNQAFGVYGLTLQLATADDTAGVLGNAFGNSGRKYGGRFFTESTDAGAAGVIGFSADAAFAGIGAGGYAGVLGIASSGEGVKGISSNTSSGEAVAGFATDSAGTVLSQGYLGYSSTTAVQAFGNIAKTGSVSFVEPHSTDPSKMVKYVSLEGNEAGTYFRGRARFQNGIATIDVPEDFRIVTQPDGLSIQVTPIGDMASVAVASIGLERIVVRGSRNVEFFYTVNGVRRGHGDFRPIVDIDKTYIPDSPEAQMPQVWKGEIRNRLIANGIYRPDGTVNMETAERLGWTRVWEEARRPIPHPVEPTPRSSHRFLLVQRAADFRGPSLSTRAAGTMSPQSKNRRQ